MSVRTYHYGPGAATHVDPRWWREKDPTVLANSMVAVARRIENDQTWREERCLKLARLYCNQDISSLYRMQSARAPFVVGAGGVRLSWNVIQSCVDTAEAKIGKNKPRALFLTSGGNWSQQKRAKGLTKFLDGLWDSTRAYEHGRRAFRDGAIFDGGVLKIYPDLAESTVKLERTLPTEILVDEAEAIYGEPRNMYQRKWVHRDSLLEAFGGKDERRQYAIEAAIPGDPLGDSMSGSEMIAVYEGWHLGQDGRHVIAIDGATLFEERWEKSYFPFAKFVWGDRITGWWGMGVAEQLVGIQAEIQRTLDTVQRAHHLFSVPRVAIEMSSKVKDSDITNQVGAIIRYAERPPQWFTPPAMGPEIYNYLETQYRKSYEITGISQLSANAKKPEGLDAAVALREFHDIESERFVTVAQRYEQMYMDAAKIQVDMAADMYKRGKDIRVKAPGTKLLEEISWKNVCLEEDQYVIRRFPTSILPTTPAGRLQKVQELVQTGFIGQTQALNLLDFPDLEEAISLQTAAYQDVRRIIERIVDTGKYETPEPYMNLDLAITETQSAILRARNEEVPEKRVLLLHQFIDDVKALQDEIKGEAAPAPQGAPAGQPALPPTGDPAALPPMAPEMAPMSPPQEMTAVPSQLPVLPPGPPPVA